MKNPLLWAFVLALGLHVLFFKIPVKQQHDRAIETKHPTKIALSFATRKAPTKEKVVPAIQKKPVPIKTPAPPVIKPKFKAKPTKPLPHIRKKRVQALTAQPKPSPKTIPPLQKKQAALQTKKQRPIQASKTKTIPKPLTQALKPPVWPQKEVSASAPAVPAKRAETPTKHRTDKEALPQQSAPKISAAIERPHQTKPSQNIRILQMSQPRYPRAARRAFREGTVQIKVRISAKGELAALSIHKSSGSEDLDQAALEAVQNWSFQAAMQLGSHIAQTAIFPVQFSLE